MELAGGQVLFEKREHVAYITINRPEARNSMNRATFEALIEAFDESSYDGDVWAVVVTGTGDQAFSAGGDLKEMNQIAREGGRFPTPMTGKNRNLNETVLETYKPTIASINGAAVAGGCELAIACDMRIMSDHAVIGLPEAKVGMGANFGTVMLPRIVPRAIAYQMLYTGEHLSAAEAERWGLVNKVVPKAELADETERFVRSIVANAPLSLRRYKEMVAKGWELSVHQAMRLNVGPNPYLSEDRAEGIRAFVEHRKPEWKGR